MEERVRFSIAGYLEAHAELSNRLDLEAIEVAVDVVAKAFHEDRKIITCGNGGSASTASHFVTDWNKMVNLATGRRFRGISLVDNVGLVTAFANDIAYNEVFAGQLAAIMDPGDLLVAVSGSGNSPNIVRALEVANELGGVTLGILGYDGGLARKHCQYAVVVPSFDMQLCEDVHLQFGHMVMKSLCGSDIVVRKHSFA